LDRTTAQRREKIVDLSLVNVDLNENPFAGTEHNTNKSLRDIALKRIMARRENRSQLAQIARDMRRGRLELTASNPTFARQCRISSNST
jgi:hypothetical protein